MQDFFVPDFEREFENISKLQDLVVNLGAEGYTI